MEMKKKKNMPGFCPVEKAIRFFQCCICLFLAFSLWGCSLALPGAGADSRDDRMVGVFITREYLDFLNMGQYRDDHPSASAQGGGAAFDASEEGKKLYAQIDKSRGSHPDEWEISFGRLEGMQMFTPMWRQEDEEPYWGNVCTEGISDTEIRYQESDDGEEHNISGTVYILPGKTDQNAAYYANPVYQTADGRIYLTGGTGVSKSGGTQEGEMLSSNLSEKTSVVENGKRRTETFSVDVKYVFMYRPARITIFQMDGEHRILKEEGFLPEEVPEELDVEKGTEYILTETEKEAPSGETTVSREVCSRSLDGESYLTTFYARDDGVVVKRESRILWEQ